MFRLIANYTKAILSDIFGITFLIFDVLGIIIFFVPSISEEINNSAPIVKQLSLWILLILFVVVNIRLYQKLSGEIKRLDEKSQQASYELAVARIGEFEEVYSDEPFSKWAAKIRNTNNWKNVVFFSGLEIEYFFFKPDRSLSGALFKVLFKRDFSEEIKILVPAYRNGITVTSNKLQLPTMLTNLLNDDSNNNPLLALQNIYLADWETKKPFVIAQHHEKRGPDSTKTSFWVIFGEFPSVLAKDLRENGYYLTHIFFHFTSNHGSFATGNKSIPIYPLDSTLTSLLEPIEKKARMEFSNIYMNLEFDPVIVKAGYSTIEKYKTKNLANKIRVVPPGLR